MSGRRRRSWASLCPCSTGGCPTSLRDNGSLFAADKDIGDVQRFKRGTCRVLTAAVPVALTVQQELAARAADADRVRHSTGPSRSALAHPRADRLCWVALYRRYRAQSQGACSLRNIHARAARSGKPQQAATISLLESPPCVLPSSV